MAPRRELTAAEQALGKLREIIDNKFKLLANLDNFPNEIEIYDDLLNGMEEVSDLCRFPLLSGRHIVAIGGAFSSGKSSFVNSFLGKDILPTAIERTTALPTYIVNAPAEVISAATLAGRMQQLRLIDFEFLTHNSAKDHNISLSTFLRYLTLSSPEMPFENIAFLDTPGYSADPQYGLAVSDQIIAEQHLRSADAIIWCVDVENGGFRQSDIEFLHRLGTSRPLWVVFNKADLKDPLELPAIKAQAENSLLSAGLAISGLTLYSSHFPEEYPAEELAAFLQEIGREKKTPSWRDVISNTFQSYVDFHSSERDNLEQQINLFNRLNIVLEAAAGQATSAPKKTTRRNSLADYEDKKTAKETIAPKGSHLSRLFTLYSGFSPLTPGQSSKPKPDKSGWKAQVRKTKSSCEETVGSNEFPELQINNNGFSADLPELLPTMRDLLSEKKNRYKFHRDFADKFVELGREIGTQLDSIRDALDSDIPERWQHLKGDSHRQLLMELIDDQVSKTCATIAERLDSHINNFRLPIQTGTITEEVSKEVVLPIPQSWLGKFLSRYFNRKITFLTKTVTVAFDMPYSYTEAAEIVDAFKLWYASLHKETYRELVEASRLSTSMVPDDVTPELVAIITEVAEGIIKELFTRHNDGHLVSLAKLLGGMETIKDDGLPILLEAMRRQMTYDIEILGNIPMHFANLFSKKFGE
jgi:GTPase SAR1 family protein